MINDFKNKTAKEFFLEMFSEKGYISSKRVVGTLMVIVALGCTIYLTIKDGGTTITEGLIQTAYIVGTSLLGISTVTGIWKGGKIAASNTEENSAILNDENRDKKDNEENNEQY